MKQFFIALVLLSFVCKNVTAQTTSSLPQPKLSAATKQFLWQYKKQNPENPTPIKGFAYKMDAQKNIYVSAIIKVNHGFNESALNALGVHVNTKAGNIWTVQVPLNTMSQFTQTNGIKYIEMDQPACPTLDSARRVTHADSVQKGYGLPQGYSGKNVVVGVVDINFDYTHPTFYDTLYQSYRIKRVWEEKNTTGPHPTEFGLSYGTEFTDSASILAKQTDLTGGFHGTHVAGIAAGSGYGSSANDSRFRGMAYGSDIALVAINPTTSYWLSPSMTDMLDGINYLFQYAQSVSKPVVVNMSWGCPLGPRDGTSLFSQAVDSLVGPGKILVISAGNNGNNTLHLKKTFSSTDSVVTTFSTFPPITDSTIEQSNLIDIWGDTSNTFCIKFSLYNHRVKTDSTVFFCLDDSTHQINLTGANNDTFSIILTAVSADYNGKPHIMLQLATSFSNTKNEDSLCITLKSDNGTVNMWQGYVLNNDGFYGDFQSNGYSWASNGDNATTIDDLATTKSAITVGSYNSKVNFYNISGTHLQYPTGFNWGTISLFSSLGPAADGRTKPDITGPGCGLASSVSAFDSSFLVGSPEYNSVAYSSVIAKFVSLLNGNTYSYAIEAGTSMSSPSVAGIVALLLQADPNLTPQDVMTIFEETAIKDRYTGTIPVNGSNTWGFGKVNAYQAMKKVLEDEGIFHLPSSTLNCLLYPNPNHGNYAVEYISDHNDVLSLSVFDISGKALIKENWQVNPGDNIHQLNLSSYPSGIYLT
jgi:minor extracellular serine protease Vpr